MHAIFLGGVLVIADSAAYLDKLVAEVVRSDLAKDHLVSRPPNRNLEIIIFGVHLEMGRDDLVEALRSQKLWTKLNFP